MVRKSELYQRLNSERSGPQPHSPLGDVLFLSRVSSGESSHACRAFSLLSPSSHTKTGVLPTPDRTARSLLPEDESCRLSPTGPRSCPGLFLKVHAGPACTRRLLTGALGCSQPFTVRHNAAKSNLIRVLFYRCVFRRESKKWDLWWKR